MFTPVAELRRTKIGAAAAPGANLRLVEDLPVAIRDLAAELGVTPAALHQQVRAGRLPAFKMRNATYVTADIARQVREWFPANRFAARWKTFTETPSSDERVDADEPVPDAGPDSE